MEIPSHLVVLRALRVAPKAKVNDRIKTEQSLTGAIYKALLANIIRTRSQTSLERSSRKHGVQLEARTVEGSIPSQGSKIAIRDVAGLYHQCTASPSVTYNPHSSTVVLHTKIPRRTPSPFQFTRRRHSSSIQRPKGLLCSIPHPSAATLTSTRTSHSCPSD